MSFSDLFQRRRIRQVGIGLSVGWFGATIDHAVLAERGEQFATDGSRGDQVEHCRSTGLAERRPPSGCNGHEVCETVAEAMLMWPA